MTRMAQWIFNGLKDIDFPNVRNRIYMESEFKAFNKILHINKLYMSITQKIHGSNAQILIEPAKSEWVPAECGYQDLNIFAGSRTRWLKPDDDNYGFCNWVIQNREELIQKLGPGRHYGEWAGPGINSGEGLSQKTLCLFNWRRWVDKQELLPKQVTIVPTLYTGLFSLDAMNEAMEKLKLEGSKLVPGYMKPEGIVIDLDGQLYKNVFDLEEVKWNDKVKRIPEFKPSMDISHLLQPLRLEKLLSRDEAYLRNYPDSLSTICKDYVADLEVENQFVSTNEDDLKLERKSLGGSIFYFVKEFMRGHHGI